VHQRPAHLPAGVEPRVHLRVELLVQLRVGLRERAVSIVFGTEGPTLAERMNAVARLALATWGEQNQIGMVAEECAEMVVALAHWTRFRVGASKVADELADVLIMAEQLRLVLEAHGVDVTDALEAKVARLEKRLTKGAP
jgi:NTP pyrophosphatase (non-canonical NTP hydrolase)